MTPVVLYIEDNADSARLVERVADALGCRLLWAATGGEGLAMAAAHLPRLILLDINLPDIDGYEVARQLRGSQLCQAIPIIAVTANALTGDAEKALASGCDVYIPKPVRIDELRKRMKEFLPV